MGKREKDRDRERGPQTLSGSWSESSPMVVDSQEAAFRRSSSSPSVTRNVGRMLNWLTTLSAGGSTGSTISETRIMMKFDDKGERYLQLVYRHRIHQVTHSKGERYLQLVYRHRIHQVTHSKLDAHQVAYH